MFQSCGLTLHARAHLTRSIHSLAEPMLQKATSSSGRTILWITLLLLVGLGSSLLLCVSTSLVPSRDPIVSLSRIEAQTAKSNVAKVPERQSIASKQVLSSFSKPALVLYNRALAPMAISAQRSANEPDGLVELVATSSDDAGSWTSAAKVSKDLQDSVDFTLYNLADIQPVRTWNYQKPTLVQAGRFTERQPWQEAGAFWNKFQESYPIFQDVDLDGFGIYGGTVVDLLLRRYPNDIDLVYFNDQGTPEEQGNAFAQRVNRFVTDIYMFTKQFNENLKRKKDMGIAVDGSTSSHKYMPIDIENLVITRYKNTYEIKVPDDRFCTVPIQITHHANLQQFLSGIDIACTAIVFYNGEIVMPESAKDALESLAFEINPCDRTARYLNRVQKYFAKGFDVILPDLDISKLQRRNLEFELTEVLDMPYFRAFYNGIRGNKIETLRCEVTNATTQRVCSDFAGYGSDSNIGSLLHRNIKHLIHGDNDEFTYIGQGENYRQAFSPDILITERMLTNSYETVGKNLFKNRALSLSKLEEYFTCRDISEILKELVIDFKKDPDAKNIYATQKFEDHVNRYLEQLVTEQIAEAKKMIVKLKGSGSLAIRGNLSNISRCDMKDWYGAYLKSV